MEKTFKRRKIVLVFISAFLIFLSSIFSTPAPVKADDYPFDHTDVMEDLTSAENFNLIHYVWDTTGLIRTPQIINFVEWCYSPFKKGDFALYVYFYNPANYSIDGTSFGNRITMATKYVDENGDVVSSPTDEDHPSQYDTFKLVYCGKSTRQNYENMFYKFRVVDEKKNGKTIEERVNSINRRYDVSAITLYSTSGTGKTYNVGGSYRFSGYSAGYGSNANAGSTLESSVSSLETISLDVHHTNYRTFSDGESTTHHNEVNTVYFSVPNKYLEDGSTLYKIKAEWYEYKTDYIFITKSSTYYNSIKQYVGQEIDYDENVSLRISTVPFLSSALLSCDFYDEPYFLYNFNYDMLCVFDSEEVYPFDEDFIPEPWDQTYKKTKINWLLNGNSDGKVTAESVANYIENFTGLGETLPVKDGTIASELFLSTVDTGRTRGYNCVEISADDTFNLPAKNLNFFEKLFKFGFSDIENNQDLENVSPIVTLDDYTYSSVIASSNSNVSNNLLINADDVQDFKTYYNTAKTNDETTCLFRFAVTDYYQDGVYVEASGVFNSHKGEKMDVAQMTTFLDFNVIQLTFRSEGEYLVIPAVSDPFDVINGISNPSINTKNSVGSFLSMIGAWGVLIISVGLGILLIVLLIKLLRGTLHAGNPIVAVVLTIVVVGIFAVIGYFGTKLVIKIINALGGLSLWI